MMNDFFLITKMGVVLSGLLAKKGKCQATPMTRRTLFFSMVFALSACSGDDSPAVATSDDVVADAVVVADAMVVADAVKADLAVKALTKIQNYAAQDTAALTVTDYTAAGITGVNEANLSATNALIKASNAAAVDTLAKIQAIATSAFLAAEQLSNFTKAQPTLSAIAGDSQVTLNWDAIPNSASYTLCHATQSLGGPADLPNCTANTNGTRVLNITNTMHTVTGLVNGTTYYFALVAVDANGNQSLPSAQASAAAVVVKKLNDTGITWGGGYPSGNNAGCTGETIAQQDCSHGRDATQNDNSDGHAGFSFTKLNSTGTALAASASVWNCVQDNVTGLIWEVKTTDDGLHDAGDLYTWYNTHSTTNGGAVGDANEGAVVDGDNNGDICKDYAISQPATYCNTEAFTERVKAAGLCGATGWRLPTITELKGIVNYATHNPVIDKVYFPNTASVPYLSSSPNANGIKYAWVANFSNGRAGSSSRNSDASVRLVSGGQ